jgi:hypothetical protein
MKKHYAASRKVAGSTPDIIRLINWSNRSSRAIALGSAKPLTKMSTRVRAKVRPESKADLIARFEMIV